jgi:hypothetical protein
VVYTVTDTKWQFGEGAAHIYADNDHRAQRSTASRIQSNNLVRLWHAFMRKMNTTHSVQHRHGYKVAIWRGSYDENEHRARTGAQFYFVVDLSIGISLYQHRQNP